MKRLLLPAFVAILTASCTQAPPPPPPAPPPSKSVTASLRSQLDEVKDYFLKSAALMPEKDYGFRPAGVAKDVRTFGQILGHVANENYVFCGASSGEKFTSPDAEKTLATKQADMTKALAESFAFCERAFAALDDQKGGDPAEIPEFNMKSTRLGMLAANTAHDNEHYGNLVTYFRAKGLVPPSSAPAK